jgi:hypothetical protein
MGPTEVVNHLVAIGFLRDLSVIAPVVFNLPLKVMDQKGFLSMDRTEISVMSDKVCACLNRAHLSVGFIRSEMVDVVD